MKVKRVTRNEINLLVTILQRIEITDEESYVVILIISKLYEMVAKEKEK